MASTRRHRVTQKAIVTGLPNDNLDPAIRDHLKPEILRGHLNLSLTDGQASIRSSRRHADRFHSYETTDRTGTRIHVAYARYFSGSPKHGYSQICPDLDVTYIYEVTAEALAVAFGLTSNELTGFDNPAAA